jgi:two-component system invasion response regulator UvrY
MAQAKKLPILIVDDHMLVRQGLKQILGYEYRDIVFGDAVTAAEALALVKTRPWCLVILDVTLPGDDGYSVLREIRARCPQTPVLMLGMHVDSQYAARAQQLGAAGYISKSATRPDLLNAIKSVLEGKKYFEESIRQEVEDEQSAALQANLSAQELRVLLALAAGRHTGEIATELNLSGKTVSTYKRRALNKMGLQSTANLVHYLIDHKLSGPS